jgi:hypothetical protein
VKPLQLLLGHSCHCYQPLSLPCLDYCVDALREGCALCCGPHELCWILEEGGEQGASVLRGAHAAAPHC